MPEADAKPWKLRTVGRCELFAEIGSGGFATVHLGRMVGAGGFMRTVAIKRLHRQYLGDEKVMDRFRAEARLVTRVRHPNVLPVIDVVQDSGELFVIMEYVEGVSLAHLMRTVEKRDHRVPLEILVSIVVGVLQGLHAAHEAKDERGKPLELTHRDVSPENVMVGTDGFARRQAELHVPRAGPGRSREPAGRRVRRLRRALEGPDRAHLVPRQAPGRAHQQGADPADRAAQQRRPHGAEEARPRGAARPGARPREAVARCPEDERSARGDCAPGAAERRRPVGRQDRRRPAGPARAVRHGPRSLAHRRAPPGRRGPLQRSSCSTPKPAPAPPPARAAAESDGRAGRGSRNRTGSAGSGGQAAPAAATHAARAWRGGRGFARGPAGGTCASPGAGGGGSGGAGGRACGREAAR
ncbi:MAG: protein kinase [Deltaproteobacteria bacterium]|nr:protein kinase [Deltaproteobacteria bacterium]